MTFMDNKELAVRNEIGDFLLSRPDMPDMSNANWIVDDLRDRYPWFEVALRNQAHGILPLWGDGDTIVTSSELIDRITERVDSNIASEEFENAKAYSQTLFIVKVLAHEISREKQDG